MLDNTRNQPTKFRTKNWIKISDNARGTCNSNSQIKFKTSIFKSSFCDYSDACIPVSGKITITGAGADDAAKQLNERNKGVVFKNCAPFIDYISEIYNTHIDNTKCLDVVMPMYNFIEYSDNYSKALEGLWQYYRDETSDNIANSKSFQFKVKITGNTSDSNNTKNVKIAVLLKYLSNFWRTLEIPLINCEINLILTCSTDRVISSAAWATKFKITDTKLYVPVVTLLTQGNVKLLEQLRAGFKKAINWNKYQPKASTEINNWYLNFLIYPSFQVVNRLFVLLFENEDDKKVHTGFYLPKVKINDYNVMIDGKNVFD